MSDMSTPPAPHHGGSPFNLKQMKPWMWAVVAGILVVGWMYYRNAKNGTAAPLTTTNAAGQTVPVDTSGGQDSALGSQPSPSNSANPLTLGPIFINVPASGGTSTTSTTGAIKKPNPLLAIAQATHLSGLSSSQVKQLRATSDILQHHYGTRGNYSSEIAALKAAQAKVNPSGSEYAQLQSSIQHLEWWNTAPATHQPQTTPVPSAHAPAHLPVHATTVPHPTPKTPGSADAGQHGTYYGHGQ